MWASTLCPLSNSTRNMAFGSVSKTLPVTSMASSLGIRTFLRLQETQNIGPTLGNRYRMFKMRRQPAVFGHGRPAIVFYFDFIAACIYHGFNGQYHPFFQPNAPVRLAIIRHRRFLVQFLPDTVSDERPDHRVAGALSGLLH